MNLNSCWAVISFNLTYFIIIRFHCVLQGKEGKLENFIKSSLKAYIFFWIGSNWNQCSSYLAKWSITRRLALIIWTKIERAICKRKMTQNRFKTISQFPVVYFPPSANTNASEQLYATVCYKSYTNTLMVIQSYCSGQKGSSQETLKWIREPLLHSSTNYYDFFLPQVRSTECEPTTINQKNRIMQQRSQVTLALNSLASVYEKVAS